MSHGKHHVHANVHEIGQGVSRQFKEAGFSFDPFVELPGSYAPPMHYSVETDSPALAHEAWRKGKEIIEGDKAFAGYLEYETLAGQFDSIFESRGYRPTNQLRLPELVLSEVPPSKHKRADLHVKRSVRHREDALDETMKRAGFYEVRTERNRIYTLQCEHVDDAKQIFDILHRHISESGGAEQVNFEVIGRFFRKPYDFRVARYLPRQRPGYWEEIKHVS